MPEQQEQYRFSAVLSGHSSDVRCIAAMPSPAAPSSMALVSGSRDLAAKLWRTTPASKDREWAEDRVFSGHQRYISAVACAAPSDAFPDGLVYTGCMSGVIRAFSPAASNPLFELDSAHAQCVSALFVSPASGTLLSGSWDGSAKVWLEKLKPVMTLTGHENAVWAVAILPESGVMVTASADKSIRLWKAGACKAIVEEAHSQAIRAVCVLGPDSFLTASNDGVVKTWSVEANSARASLVRSVAAHDHFVYAICSISAADRAFAAAGESSGVKVFRGEEVTQVLPIPAISVWDVVCFPNGDLAASSSDGKIWIFSRDPKRHADEAMNGIYELELSKFKRPAKTELEGVKTEDLPGPNALLAPGKRDGQTKMVRDGGVISVHSWSQADQKWQKIGDVVGQPDAGGQVGPAGAAPDGGKIVYEGKEYDFVFDIELDMGGKLKLPFNREDDVWHTAQTFINKHELPQVHLDTIANFLVKNGGGQVRSANSQGVWDPLTGGSAYTTNGDETPMEVDNSHFPQKEFLTFPTQPKLDALTKKLKELNTQVPEDKKVPEDQLEKLHQLCLPDANLTQDDVLPLGAVLRWPKEATFPALDVFRLLALNRRFGPVLLAQPDLFGPLADSLKAAAPETSQLLALRALANLFSSKEGAGLLVQRQDEVFMAVLSLLPKESKSLQVALATLMLNYSVCACANRDEVAQAQCVTAICMMFLEATTDAEAKYRILVALGTLMQGSQENVKLVKELQVATFLKGWKLTAGDVKKVEECATFVLKFL